jgi:hypothetical protein
MPSRESTSLDQSSTEGQIEAYTTKNVKRSIPLFKLKPEMVKQGYAGTTKQRSELQNKIRKYRFMKHKPPQKS